MATIFWLVLFTELIIFSTPMASGAAGWANIGLYSASSSSEMLSSLMAVWMLVGDQT